MEEHTTRGGVAVSSVPVSTWPRMQQIGERRSSGDAAARAAAMRCSRAARDDATRCCRASSLSVSLSYDDEYSDSLQTWHIT